MPQAANGPPKLGTQFYMKLDVPEDEEDGVRRIGTSVRLVRVVNVDVGDDAVTVDLELLPYATDIDPAPDDVGSCACGAAAPEAGVPRAPLRPAEHAFEPRLQVALHHHPVFKPHLIAKL